MKKWEQQFCSCCQKVQYSREEIHTLEQPDKFFDEENGHQVEDAIQQQIKLNLEICIEILGHLVETFQQFVIQLITQINLIKLKDNSFVAAWNLQLYLLMVVYQVKLKKIKLNFQYKSSLIKYLIGVEIDSFMLGKVINL